MSCHPSRRRPSPAATLVVCAAAAAAAVPLAAAGGGDILTLVAEGDAVGGVGLVTRIDNLAVNDAGVWLVEADTDNADADADSVLLRDGALLLREGDGLALPVGASIGSFDSININNAGDSAWNFFLDGTSGTSDDSGIFKNTTLVVQEGDPAPAAGFSPGTVYLGFFDVKNSNTSRFVSVLTVDDPAIPSTVDRAVVEFEDPGMGFIQRVIAKEGDVLPGQTEPIQDFETGPHESAYNDLGRVLIGVDLAGDSSVDGTIYIMELDADDDPIYVKLAQEGDPAADTERDWLSLSSPELDLGNHGHHVYSGRMTGDTATDTVIVLNGEVFRQEGDAVPGLSPGGFALTSFGSGPLLVSDAGSVLWYGDWDDPDTDRDTGLFVDDTLLVQEGVTQIGGVTVDTVRGVSDGYAMSDGGQYVVFEAVLVNGVEGAFLIDLGPPCLPDIDGDGIVGFPDLLLLLSKWGPCPGCPEDIDGNEEVGFPDLLVVLSTWGACP
jgi:hypothetical protein